MYYPTVYNRKSILLCVIIIAVLNILILVNNFVYSMEWTRYIPFFVIFFSLPIAALAWKDLKYLRR